MGRERVLRKNGVELSSFHAWFIARANDTPNFPGSVRRGQHLHGVLSMGIFIEQIEARSAPSVLSRAVAISAFIWCCADIVRLHGQNHRRLVRLGWPVLEVGSFGCICGCTFMSLAPRSWRANPSPNGAGLSGGN